MSYYRRGYSWEVQSYLPAPTGGWGPDAPASLLPDTQAQVLDNFLVQPGKIEVRRPFAVAADLSAHAPLNVMSVVMGDQQDSGYWTLLGLKDTSGGGSLDPWNAPVVKPSSGATVAQAGLTAYWKTKAGPVQSLTVTRDNAPGPRWVDFDGLLYGIAYDASGSIGHEIYSGYQVRATSMLTMPLSQAAPTAPTVQNAAPHGARDIKQYLSRIWLLAGIDTPGSVTTFNATTLFFTNPIATGGGTTGADWKDPISGLTNQIVVDKNSNDPGVALATVRGGLLIFRRHSVWILRGTTSASFSLQLVSREVGCVDARSVLECDAGVYFLSHKGLMLCDGVRVRNLSGPVTQTLQKAIDAHQWAIDNLHTGYATCALTTNGGILVSIGAYISNSVTPIWSALYDVSTGAWVRLTSSIWAQDGTILRTGNEYPGWVYGRQDRGQLFSVGDKYITRLEDVQATQFSFLYDGQNAPGLFDQLPDGTFAPIPATWVTGMFPMGNPNRKKAQAKRFFVDYVFQGYQLPYAGFTAAAVDENYSTIGTAQARVTGAPIGNDKGSVTLPVANAGLPDVTPTVQHANVDFSNEVVDLAFQVTWTESATSTQPLLVRAELHGIGVEFQPTSDRR